MTSNEFYSQVLGLSAPWHVVDVDLDMSLNQVRVYVEHDPFLGRLCCSVCGSECPGYDTQAERTWRHLDTCQLKTYLVCSLPRVQCAIDGIRVARAPWAEPNSHFTLLFERFAISVLQAMFVQSRACRLLRLSPDQVRRIMDRAVTRGLNRRSHDEVIEAVGIDEKMYANGQKYATVLTDTKRGRVLDLIEERTIQAATSILERNLTPAQRRNVLAITMDMWPGYANAAGQVLPNADVVYDRYHVATYLNKAVDETRRAEHVRLNKTGSSPLKDSRYVWLRNPENLNDKHKALFEALSAQNLETAKVWAFKDTFREFFTITTVNEAQAFFDNWHSGAIALRNRFLTKVAKMLKRHLAGLLAYAKHALTNAMAETINAKIQLVKANARGYRRFANFRTAVLFFHGQLQLNP